MCAPDRTLASLLFRRALEVIFSHYSTGSVSGSDSSGNLLPFAALTSFCKVIAAKQDSAYAGLLFTASHPLYKRGNASSTNQSPFLQ